MKNLIVIVILFLGAIFHANLMSQDECECSGPSGSCSAGPCPQVKVATCFCGVSIMYCRCENPMDPPDKSILFDSWLQLDSLLHKNILIAMNETSYQRFMRQFDYVELLGDPDLNMLNIKYDGTVIGLLREIAIETEVQIYNIPIQPNPDLEDDSMFSIHWPDISPRELYIVLLSFLDERWPYLLEEKFAQKKLSLHFTNTTRQDLYNYILEELSEQ